MTHAKQVAEKTEGVTTNQPGVGSASNRENREPMIEGVPDAEALALELADTATGIVMLGVGRPASELVSNDQQKTKNADLLGSG